MKSKNFLKPTGAALVLGSSLASLVGQQSASANLLGSIKNFFFGDETKNEEKKLSLKERKEKFNIKNQNFFSITQTSEEVVVGATVSTILLYRFFSYMDLMHDVLNNRNTSSVSEAIIDSTSLKIAGIGLLAYIGVEIFGIIRDKKLKKEYLKLKEFIKEDKLEKQWKFEKFKEMAEKDDDESKRFLEQLLVLEPSSSESGNNEENVPHLNSGGLNEKVQAFKELFTKEPEELKNVENNGKKEIYKEIINSLFNWCSGKMERLYDDSIEGRYDEKKYFKEQDDIELVSKITLLKEIVLDGEDDYPECLSFLTSEDFYENLVDKSKPNFKKLLLYDIRKYVTEEDAGDDDIIKILTELTKSTNVGTIKTMRDHVTYRKHNVLVISAEGENKSRNNQIFKDELKTFSEEREKKENEVYIYKKQLRILNGIKEFSEKKHKFKERFDKREYKNGYGYVYIGIVDNLSFRAQAAYEGIEEEYNKIVKV